MKISTVIIAKNEEEMITGCIKSASIADEVIVIDDYSQDKTTEISKKMGAKVFKRKLDGFASQKNYGIEKSKNNWVLILDADERLTPELSNEISNLKADRYIAYDMPFRNYVGKKWLKHGGLYPDRHIRLFNKKSCRYGDKEIHEELKISGEVGHLKNDIVHQTYSDFKEYAKKVKKYALLESETTEDKPAPIEPFKVFISRLLKQRGILDGIAGIKSAYLLGYYQYLIRQNMK